MSPADTFSPVPNCARVVPRVRQVEQENEQSRRNQRPVSEVRFVVQSHNRVSWQKLRENDTEKLQNKRAPPALHALTRVLVAAAGERAELVDDGDVQHGDRVRPSGRRRPLQLLPARSRSALLSRLRNQSFATDEYSPLSTTLVNWLGFVRCFSNLLKYLHRAVSVNRTAHGATFSVEFLLQVSDVVW